MDCEQAAALVCARLDHEMRPEDRVLLDLHLRDCPACRAAADAFAMQHQELRRAFEPRRRAAAAVAERVVGQLPNPAPATKAFPSRRRVARGALVLAAVAAAALVALLVQHWLRPPTHATASSMLKPLGLSLTGQDQLTPRPLPAPPPATKLAVGGAVETRAGEKRRLALPDGSVLYVNENTRAALGADRHVALTAGTVYVEVAPRDPAADGSTFAVDTPEGPVKAFGTKFEVRADAVKGSAVTVVQGRVTFDDAPVAAGQELALAPAAEVARTNTFQLTAPVPTPRVSHVLDWTRDLMAAAESPLVPASAYDGGALVAVDPYGQEAKLSLRNYHVDVHVEDGFARTTIDQTYFNNTPWRLEGTFYFPLPPDASLSRLAMYVDGNLMEGGMTDRDYGSAVYEKIVRAKRDPALLEWVDGSTFKMRVFPLEGRQEKRIILSYTQRLPTLYGRTQYRFPAGHSIQVVDHWSFHAVVKNGGTASWNSPTHPNLRGKREGDDLVLDFADSACKVDRDVEVNVIDPHEDGFRGERVRFSSAEADGAGYLMLRYRPELPTQGERRRRNWVFLFESSADRDPLLARAQVEIVRHMLGHLDKDDQFAVLAAGTETHAFQPELQPAQPGTAAAAVAFLEQTHLIGALDLGRALADARPFLEGGDETWLVHVGSGYTAMGRRQEALADLIPAGVHYVGIGVGKHWDRAWMKERAEATGGYFTQINPDEPIAWRAFDLVSTLNTPRLLHVQVSPGQDAEQPRFLTDQSLVAQGEEVCAVAQVPRVAAGALALPRSVVVTGVLDGQPFRRELPVQAVASHADYLPRTWAKWEIDRLLAANPIDNRPRIVELSKAMYVMTPFTSLLVLENEEMYKEYNVDRGRKDHWAMYPCPQTIPVVFEPDPTQPIDVRNAPKTPKQVANVVLPTVVRRPTPQFLGGGTETREDTALPERLKDVLGDQERFLGRGEFGGRIRKAHFRRDRAAIDDYFALGFYGDSGSNLDRLAHPLVVNEDDRIYAYASRGADPLSGVEFDEPPTDALRLKATSGRDIEEFGRPALSKTPYFGQVLMAGIEHTRENVIQREFEKRKAFPDDQKPGLPVDGTRVVRYTLTSGEAKAKYRGRIESGWTPTLLYQPPTYTGDARLFGDLVSYAPGLNTTDADVRAVLDAEAAPNLADAPGHIDADARRLIEQSRRPRWRTLTVGGSPAVQFTFDGAGRYVYERTLPLGLHERVVCDGETLWHLYPELGLAARRTVSRFHRADIAALTPWALPPAEDLARGADVEAVDARTVALVPLGARTRRTDDDQPAPYYCLLLVFGDDGRLAEHRLEEMPAGKLVGREVYDDKGGVRVLDADGKDVASRQSKIADAAVPDLSADVANLVVVRMPLRSRAKVFEDLRLDASRPLADDVNGCYRYLEGEQRVDLLVGAMTEGNAGEAGRIFRDLFASHGDLRRGLFPLLSAAGVNVGAEPGFQAYLATHMDDPLARYFALLGNPAYAFLHRTTAVEFGDKVGPDGGLLARLAAFRDLETRWNAAPSWLGVSLRRADEGRTFAFIRRNRDDALGWALQIHAANHAPAGDRRLRLALADAWGALAGDDPEAYAARYEQARCLLKAGKDDEARKFFLGLYGAARKVGGLPSIDGDFRDALRGKADEWTALAWKTAAELVDQRDRPGVVLLAWQCRQVGDEPLADNLLAFALDGFPKGAEGVEATLAAVEYLWQNDQLAKADDLLNGLIASDPANANDAHLWRLAAQLAEKRDRPARAAECLETALDLEYHDLPPVIDLQAWRADYGKLLSYYESQATTLAPPPVHLAADLAARTIRAADRWRAHDPDAKDACRYAANVLRALGEEDAAWDYLTTPAAGSPDAVSWPGLATDLGRRGDVDLADRCFAAACDHDPDDALLLWRRAVALRAAGRDAGAYFHSLADGDWPPAYQWIRERARWQLAHKEQGK